MADSKSKRRYENLNRLSIEQLEKLLRTAPFMPDDQETSKYLDAIEEVILQRETEHPTGRIQDVESAWSEFQEHYLPLAGESAETPSEERSEILTRSVKKSGPYAKKLFRKIVPLAAAIAVVFMSMIAAQAAGVDIFGSLAHWTEETFHFNGGNSTPAVDGTRPLAEDETYLAIQAEVDELDIDFPVIPTWIPNGYELEEVTPFFSDAVQAIDVVFLNGDQENLFVTIEKYKEDQEINKIVFEKDGRQVTEYFGKDKLFYIMSNNETKTAVWSDGHVVISINGKLEEESIKKMIDSIGGFKS